MRMCLAMVSMALMAATDAWAGPAFERVTISSVRECRIGAYPTLDRLADGRLLCVYSWDTSLDKRAKLFSEGEEECVACLMASSDRGLTWKTISHVSTGDRRLADRTGAINGLDEPALVGLSDGSLYMLCRTGVTRLYESRSKDGGRSWSKAAPSPLASHNAPASLCRFGGKRPGVLAVWCNSPTNRWPLCAAASFDDCKSWSTPRRLTQSDGNEQSYPACIEAEDRTLVAAWQEAVPGGREVRSARFGLDWLLSPSKTATMKLAVSTASFGRAFQEKKLALLDFPELCARAGLEAIELNDFCLKGDWTVIRELKQRAATAGLDICAVAVESNFYRASPAEIERERRHIEEYIGIASYLGAPLLRVVTCPYGKHLPAAIIPKGVTDEMAFAAAVQTFRPLMPLAEKHGITFVLENHGGISRTSADQIKITKAVESKWFRINLDTGNYHADPMAGTEPFEDFLEATPKVAPYLAFCHAKIWDVTDDLREPTLDYDRFFVLLRKFNYQGPISIEYMGKKDVIQMLPKCVALLKRCRARQPR